MTLAYPSLVFADFSENSLSNVSGLRNSPNLETLNLNSNDLSNTAQVCDAFVLCCPRCVCWVHVLSQRAAVCRVPATFPLFPLARPFTHPPPPSTHSLDQILDIVRNAPRLREINLADNDFETSDINRIRSSKPGLVVTGP